MLTAATLLGMVLFGSKLSNSSIMMVYLLGVLLVAVITSHRAYSMAASVASLFLFNFFFVQPRYSLAAYEPGYPVSFVVMFLTAVIAGTLANRLKQTAYLAERTSFRARIISDTDRLLAKAESREEAKNLLRQNAEELEKHSAEMLKEAKAAAEQDRREAEEALAAKQEQTSGRLQNAAPELASVLADRLLGGE